jgi:hypothetical protein
MQRNYALNPVTLGLHNNTLYEPQRTNHFEVYIYLPTIIAGGDAAKIEQFRKYITLATTDFSLPNITVSPIQIPYGNTKINLAGSVEYGGADSLTCTDFIGADVEGILYAWQNLVYSPETGQIGWATNYKTDAKVLEYSADGACLSSWILRGVWPSAVDYGNSMSKGDSQVKNVTVTLAYDLAYRKYGKSTRNTTPQAAAQAMTDMNWKTQETYNNTNAGGSIQVVKDNYN